MRVRTGGIRVSEPYDAGDPGETRKERIRQNAWDLDGHGDRPSRISALPQTRPGQTWACCTRNLETDLRHCSTPVLCCVIC